jgi:hypothetical protein
MECGLGPGKTQFACASDLLIVGDASRIGEPSERSQSAGLRSERYACSRAVFRSTVPGAVTRMSSRRQAAVFLTVNVDWT